MPTPPPNPPIERVSPVPRRPRWSRVSRAAALTLVTGGLALAGVAGPDRSAPAVAPDGLRPAATVTSTARVGTFNLLGAAHTRPSGNKPDYASGWKRMGWALQLMDEQDLEVIGLQELEVEQHDRFLRDGAATYEMWPGRQLARNALANSIIWRKDTWQAVERRTVQVPYFYGNYRPMPYVLLEHRQTGARAWFYNSHNPADTRGPHQQWRDLGYRIEADLINRLRADSPDVPVLTLGDKNDRDDFICPVSAATGAVSANGARVVNGTCQTPRRMRIDWIAGTPDITWETYEELTSGLIERTTDHPLIMSRISVSHGTPAPAEQVVVVAVEGLRSDTLRNVGRAGAPTLHGMVARGASTWNARTAYESTQDLPNLVGVLVGRPVRTELRGHGVHDTASGATVHEAAGRYVSSVFDLVHNHGMGTAMVTSTGDHRVVDATWDADSGGRDPFGADDGTDKIDTFRVVRNDERTTVDGVGLLQDQDPALLVLHYTGLDVAGEQSGFGSATYRTALKALDARIGRVLAATGPETLVLVTGTHGGTRRSHDSVTEVGNYKVPFLAVGPQVPAGAGMYALNPDLAFPGPRRVGYGAERQPLRNGHVPELVTTALGVPGVPGAGLVAGRQVTVFGR